MKKIIFPIKNISFAHLAATAKKYNYSDFDLIKQAFDQKVLIENDNLSLMKKFIKSFEGKQNIKSQLYQDVCASFIIENKFDKTFLEFGATDGLEYSNSFMLENNLSWNGVLSEPSPQWHEALKKNRKKAKILTECIWKDTGKKMDFFMSDEGNLSTLKDFVDNDKISIPTNSITRKKSGKIISVETISLNDVIKNYFNGNCPSYISIDTEGSEYEILKSFDLENFRPKLFTIEHNFTENETKIDQHLFDNGYVRIFKKLTAFDAWYVCRDRLKQLELQQ